MIGILCLVKGNKMDNLRFRQREEAAERLKILGYNKEIRERYLDIDFQEKLQEAESRDIPEINIAPFIQMEEDEDIFTYLYRYSILNDGRLQLRLFFVNNKENMWEKERALLRTAMEKGVDTQDAKDIFKTFVTEIK